MRKQPTEVAIVGGGVEGSSIAYHLTRTGARVTLLERWGIAAGASGASAGGVRHQGRDLREFPLAFRAIELWLRLEQELAADVHYRRDGHATTIEDEADLPILQDSVQLQRAHGLDIYVVQGEELRHLIPGISPSVIAAAYTPHDGHANPTLTTQAFSAAAERQGATVRTGVIVTGIYVTGGRVTGIETSEGPVAADVVVLAAGAWSIELAAGIDVDLHCSPDGYQAMTTQPMAPHLAQVLGSLRRMISLKQLPDGRYLLGGGWPGQFALTDPRGQVIEENIANNVDAAVGVLPDVARAVVQEAWIGIDAHGHDEVPVLGHVDGIDGLIVATGFSGHGFALSPAVGEAIAGLITTGASPIDLSQLGWIASPESRASSPTCAMPDESPAVRGIDHVQITIPVGAEEEARAFYLSVLGLSEIPKPASLTGRGGFWCEAGGFQVHIGVEDGSDRLTTRAHVAYAVDDIAAWRVRLDAAGCEILDSVPIPSYDRFETRDPFGNRLELIAPADSET